MVRKTCYRVAEKAGILRYLLVKSYNIFIESRGTAPQKKIRFS